MSVESIDVISSLSKHILADGFEPVMDLEKSHGSWLVDERNGAEYLDMFSMFASGAVGYNHPSIVSQRDRLAISALNKPTLSDIYNVYYAEFLDTFSRIAIPEYLPHVFFIEGGSLAVENALKVAFDWKVRKNLSIGKGEKGSKIIHFKQAFHGRSGYTLSLTNTTDPRKTMYFPKFPWFKVDNPKLSFPLNDDVIENVVKSEKIVINNILKIIKSNTNDISSIIIEPIQGEGGDNHFRNDFMIELRNICDNYDIILIFDEVQTGVGITGKMWAHEHFSIKPDIISFGKKTQVCGMMAGSRIYNYDSNVFKESSRINSTFGGNLVDMYRFKLILEIIENERLLNNANVVGKYLLNKISQLSDNFPGYVINPRGLGLFCAFDMPSTLERDKLLAIALEKNLMILGSGDYSVRFRPHLNVTIPDIDLAIEIIFKSIKDMLN